MGDIRFGTDGWRAIISQDFTFENIKRASQAIAVYFKEITAKGVPKLAVGYDSRFLSSQYARLIAEIFLGNGIEVFFLKEVVPTPCLCYAIKKENLSGGVMVTASHNSYCFNGIKIKTASGAPATADVTKRIEALIDKYKISQLNFDKGIRKGKLEMRGYRRKYLNFLKSYLDFSSFQKTHLRIIHDAMHGCGNNLLAELLADTNIKIRSLRSNYDPLFGGVNPEPIPQNIKDTIALMKDERFQLAIITDGDADRIAAIAPGGKFITPGWILSLLLLHFLENRKERGGVVKTISNSSLIEKIARHYGLSFYETPVGFKYIADLMQKDDILIGGEESGGIGFKNYMPERDGLLAGLLLIELLVKSNSSINEIIKDIEKNFGRHCYRRIDIEYPDQLKQRLFKRLSEKPFQNIVGKKVIDIKTYDGIKFILADGSWLLFRLSGTEPILRLYCEAPSLKQVKQILEFARSFSFSLKR